MQTQVWTEFLRPPSTLQDLCEQSCKQIKYNQRPVWASLQRWKQKQHHPAPVMTPKDLPASEVFSNTSGAYSSIFLGKLCSFIIQPEMFSCKIKWQNPDGGPFNHAEYRILSMLFWHWQWQYLFFYTFVISHEVTLLNLNNCFYLSRSVCFTIKKKHLSHFLSPVGFYLYPHQRANAYAFLSPPLGLTPYPSLFYPYLSAQKGSSAGFVICCKGSQDIL